MLRQQRVLIAVLIMVGMFASTLGIADEGEVKATGKIAFMSERDENWEIYIMDLDGSHQTNLTNTHRETEMNPHFSSDGSKILFQSGGSLYTMSPDGTNRMRIATDELFVFNGRFSWDGTRIVFSAVAREEVKPPPSPGEGQKPESPGEKQPPVPPTKG